MLKIYLDTNVYCRPSDDQSQKRIRAETLAFLKILQSVIEKQILLIGSDIIDVEIDKHPNEIKRERAKSYQVYCSSHVEESEELVGIGKKLMEQAGLRPRDALHIASAAADKADYFITCDDKVRNKKVKIVEVLGYGLNVMTPVEYIKKRGGG